MLLTARCDPVRENPVHQPLSQLGCRKNTWTRLGSGAPGPLLPENAWGQAQTGLELRMQRAKAKLSLRCPSLNRARGERGKAGRHAARAPGSGVCGAGLPGEGPEARAAAATDAMCFSERRPRADLAERRMGLHRGDPVAERGADPLPPPLVRSPAWFPELKSG